MTQTFDFEENSRVTEGNNMLEKMINEHARYALRVKKMEIKAQVSKRYIELGGVAHVCVISEVVNSHKLLSQALREEGLEIGVIVERFNARRERHRFAPLLMVINGDICRVDGCACCCNAEHIILYAV